MPGVTNNCSLALKGMARDCEPSQGGLKRILFAPASAITSVTADNGVISAISPEGKPFYEYKLRPGTSNWVSTIKKDETTGANYRETVISLQFNRMSADKWAEVEALANDDLVAISEDMNGKYWYHGFDDPVTANGGESGTGQARGDANHYGITLIDNSRQLPMEVSESIIDGLVNAL